MSVVSGFEDIKKLLPEDFSVVGVGVTAFTRTGLNYVLGDKFEILTLFETSDLNAIRDKIKVITMESDLCSDIPEKLNTSSILKDEKVQEYLKNKKYLFVYKRTKLIDKLAKELELKVLGTPGEIRKIFENKKEFRKELVKANIEPIIGETLLVDSLDESKLDEFKKKFGDTIVLQLPDYTIGGGIGTFFIKTKEDFKSFKDFVKSRRKEREIYNVNVTRFIDGKQTSITGCATRHGTICGLLQTQVIDQKELSGLTGRSGVWLGHDWNIKFEKDEQLKAENLCKKWGNYIYKQGYKGIFGLDLIIDSNGKIWPVECNARYTGAFPVYTMMQLKNNEIPIDLWHLLEWADVDYELDIDKMQKIYRQPKNGAHLVIHNLEKKFVIPTNNVKAGVYKMTLPSQPVKPIPRRLIQVDYLRPGFSLLDIKNENEFVLCGRIMSNKRVLKPAERMGRLLFDRQVIDESGRLLPDIRGLVRAVYKKFELMPVEKPEGI